MSDEAEAMGASPAEEEEAAAPAADLDRGGAAQILEHLFFSKRGEGATEVVFERSELDSAADEIGVPRQENKGHVIHHYRNRSPLPPKILETAPEGKTWVLRITARATYAFTLVDEEHNREIAPDELLAVTKIPDATPGMIVRYAQGDEQALLAKLRYNRVIDIFTGVTCYSLQSHYVTTLSTGVQVEIDELYVGVGRSGVHYVFPVEAKGSHERLGTSQIRNNILICGEKFEDLQCRAIGAKFIADDAFALFELQVTEEGLRKVGEARFRLVAPDDLSREELQQYRERLAEAGEHQT